MGRKPTPTNLKILKGNPGKRPLPKDEPIPRPIMPEPPNHLCEVAKQEWEKICPGLYTAGILTEIDKAIVSAYCTSYAIWEKSVSEKLSEKNSSDQKFSSEKPSDNKLFGKKLLNKQSFDKKLFGGKICLI